MWVGGGGHTVLFLSLYGVSKVRLSLHISQSDVICFSFAVIPNFPEAEVHDFRYEGGAEYDFEGMGNSLQTKHAYLSSLSAHFQGA